MCCILRSIAGLALLAGSLLAVALPGSAQQNDPGAWLALLAEINEWRLDYDLPPLRPNTTLRTLANRQAEHLLTLEVLPDGPLLHYGAAGEGPTERALWPEFDWPVYGRRERINLTEIIAAQHDARAAVHFWQGSPIHYDSVLNPSYREIGIAAVPYHYGFLFVVELAGRPNVLPALLHPSGDALYLTNEHFWGAAGGSEWVTNAAQVRLLDAARHPLTSWQPWTPVLPLPESCSGDIIYVEYTDLRTRVISRVNLRTDIFPLPQYFEALVMMTPTAQPSCTAVPPESVDSTPTPGPTAAPEALMAASHPRYAGDLMLLYDAGAFTLVNVSSEPQMLLGLAFRAGDGNTVHIADWDNGFLSASLPVFPSGECLMAWSMDVFAPLPVPELCEVRDAWIAVCDAAMFWTAETFDVYRYGEHLATCHAVDGHCAVDLP